MRKLYLFLALLLTFSSSAWADFDQPWTSTGSPWGSEAATDVPEAVTALKVTNSTGENNDGDVYSTTVNVVRVEGDSRAITVSFTYAGGSNDLRILGVELLNSSSEVVANVYQRKSAGGNQNGAIYSLSTTNISAGNYSLRYYVCVGSGKTMGATRGFITVRGLNAQDGTGFTNYKSITSLEELSNEKVYWLKSGRSMKTTATADVYNDYYVVYNSDFSTDYITSTFATNYTYSKTFSETDNSFWFAIYKSGDAYYLYNVGANKFVGNNNAGDGPIPTEKLAKNQIYIKSSPNGSFNWLLSTNNFSGTLNAGNTTGNNNNGLLNWSGGGWYTSDLGNCYSIIEVNGETLTDDIKATLSDYTSWAPGYNKIQNLISSPSDERVGAITTSGVEAVTTACNSFEATPTTDTYNAMMAAYNANSVTLSAGEVFTIQCTSTDRGYLAYSPNHSKTHAYLAGTGGGWATKFPDIDAENVSIKWAYYEKQGKKYIYNYNNKVFIGAESGIIPVNIPKYVTINADTYNPIVHRICFEGNTNSMLSFSPGYDGKDAVRTFHDANDGGVQFYLVKTGESPISTEVAAVAYEKAPLKKKLNEMGTLGTGVGKYHSDNENAQAIVDNANTVSNSDAATSEEVTAALTNLNALVLIINQPEVRKLYRFKSYANTYLTSNIIQRADNQNYLLKTENATASYDYPYTLFYLTEDNKLLSYQEGLKLGDFNQSGLSRENANNAWTMPGVGQAGAAFTFVEGTKIGTYKLRPGGNREICANELSIYNGSGKNYMVDAAGTGQTSDKYNWTIEEVTWLPIPINTTYRFGTLVAPANLASAYTGYAQDARLKFYTATIGSDGYVELTKVTGDIKAGKPYVIELMSETGMSQGSQFMKIVDSAPELTAKNALRGGFETIAKPTDEGTIYTLQAAWINESTVSANEVAFRQYNGETIKGFRAYLPVTGNRQIAGMRINDGETTLIEGVQAEQSHKVDVYDLSGRRVQRAHKGLYIINGKKVIVK